MARNDESARKATGRTWDEWFTWLDAQGAAALDHKGIVALLKPVVESGWWRQGLTVEYERARGKRELHQAAGGFQVSRSRTYDAPASALFAAWTGDRPWLGEFPLELRTSAADERLRFRRPDGTAVQVYLAVRTNGRCAVTVLHEKLPDREAAEAMKAFWSAALGRLGEAV